MKTITRSEILKELPHLVDDIAAFNNMKTKEVWTMLFNSLVGGKGLEQVGIKLDEAEIEAKLNEMELECESRETLERKKMVAGLALIFEKSEPMWGEHEQISSRPDLPPHDDWMCLSCKLGTLYDVQGMSRHLKRIHGIDMANVEVAETAIYFLDGVMSYQNCYMVYVDGRPMLIRQIGGPR